jgi:hypothetical protein
MTKSLFHQLLNARVTATGICLLLLVLTVNAQDPGLAEKASTAGAVPNSLDPNVVGSTLGGDYHNGYFDFDIRHIPGWTTMSRGMLTVNEAVGRDALGMKAGRNPSGSRVFGMHDAPGCSVILAIFQIPVGAKTDSASLKSHLIQMTMARSPDAQVADETVLLDDSDHHFTALRVNSNAANKEVFQSLQLLPLGRYELLLTITAPSLERLQEVIQQLQSRLQC